MHSMVSLVRKLRKALFLRSSELHEVDDVYYKEARSAILILIVIFVSLGKQNSLYLRWL